MPGRPRRRFQAADALLDRAYQLLSDLEALATPAALAEDFDPERADAATRIWAAAIEAADEFVERMEDVAGLLALRIPVIRKRMGLPRSWKLGPDPLPPRPSGPYS